MGGAGEEILFLYPEVEKFTKRDRFVAVTQKRLLVHEEPFALQTCKTLV